MHQIPESSKTMSQASVLTDRRKMKNQIIIIPKNGSADELASPVSPTITLSGSPINRNDEKGQWCNKFKKAMQKPFKISDMHIKVKVTDDLHDMPDK